MRNSQTAFKVREQLNRFWWIFSPRFLKPATDSIGDMPYGLQTAKDVKTSRIGRGIIFNHIMDNGLRFIVRLVGNRAAHWRGRHAIIEHLVGECPCVTLKPSTAKPKMAQNPTKSSTAHGTSNLPWRGEPLRLAVVKGLGKKPLMLLTNVAVTDSRKSLWQIIESCLTRWHIEDALRFINQSYRLEDIRLLDYMRLQNIMAVILAAVFSVSSWLGESVRRGILVRNITRVSKRLFGVPDFHYYALADGIARLFNRFGHWRHKYAAETSNEQIELPLDNSGLKNGVSPGCLMRDEQPRETALGLQRCPDDIGQPREAQPPSRDVLREAQQKVHQKANALILARNTIIMRVEFG